MIYVYTVIADGWDNLRAPEVVSFSEDVRYLCYTNIPNLPAVRPWEYRPLPRLASGARMSRLPKILPHLLLPDDAHYSIYHDGNFQLRKLPEDVIRECLVSHDWAAHKHPARNCIYEEAAVLLRERIGSPDLIAAQIDRYRAMRYPEEAGLWANGFLVRRHTGAVAELCETWWKEFAEGCERDQVSFPFARKRAGLEVNTIDAMVYQSPFLNFYWHAAWKERACNFDFVPERRRVSSNLARLRALAGIDLDFPAYACEAAVS